MGPGHRGVHGIFTRRMHGQSALLAPENMGTLLDGTEPGRVGEEQLGQHRKDCRRRRQNADGNRPARRVNQRPQRHIEHAHDRMPRRRKEPETRQHNPPDDKAPDRRAAGNAFKGAFRWGGDVRRQAGVAGVRLAALFDRPGRRPRIVRVSGTRLVSWRDVRCVSQGSHSRVAKVQAS